MTVHPTHVRTPRNDMVGLKTLMDNIERGGPAGTAMSPDAVEAEEARRFEQHAKENRL